LGQRQAGLAFDPRQRLLGVDLGPGQRPAGQAQEPVGDDLLCPVQPREEDAALLADRVRDHRSLDQLEFQRGLHQLQRYLKQAGGKRHQFVAGQTAVALVHRLGQRVRDAGAHPHHGRLVDAEPHRNCIGGLEADAADVARQPVRVLRHDLDGIGAIGLEDAHGACRAHAMAVQEDHDLAHDLLLGPGACDALGAHRPDAGHLAQAIWLTLDDIEHPLAESLDELPGVDRADAADHAGGEILLDAFGRCRSRAAQKAGLELLAMGAVVDPFARGGDPLAGRDRGGVPDGGHEITVPARLDTQNAEAVLGIMVGDALDETRQHLLGR
jgi:hypothetical protein